MKLEIRKIDPFVGELLYEHDCVIITDLGGFVASYRQASVNPALHVLSPPSKRIAFNASLRHNDGLLANHISYRTGMTYPEACDTIRDYVNEAFRHLESGKRVNIEKVGVLFMDAHRNLQFTPENHSNFLVESFGLSPVHAPVIKREEEEVTVSREAVVKTFRLPRKQAKKKGLGVLEMIPAAAVLAILFITPPALQRFNAEMSGMLPFSRIIEVMEEVKGKEEPQKIQFTPAVIPNLFLVPKKSSSAGTVQTVAPDTTNVVKEIPAAKTEAVIKESSSVVPVLEMLKPVHEKQFHVIGGCFRSEGNAAAFANEMSQKGFDAKAIGKSPSGLYMVSLFQTENRGQAEAQLQKIKDSAATTGWIWTAE